MESKLPSLQVPEQMRDLAEKSLDQARKAFDEFLGAAQKGVASVDGSAQAMRASSQEMTRKALSCADRNMKAAFDHAQKLVRAKDPQEAMQLQTDFVKSQFMAMQTQMKDLGAGVQQAASDVTQGVRKQA